MAILNIAVLAIHIISGTIALLTGLHNMIGRKGGVRHRLIGKAFTWSMFGVAFSALALSASKGSVFFFYLGVFTFYMTWNGNRSAVKKKVVFTTVDISILLIGLANTLVMLFHGNPVLLGLGVLSGTLVFREVLLFRKIFKQIALPANAWLVRHIGMMVGSYISTLTAFLVVNWNGFGPYWLPWTLPPVILVPCIIWWSARIAKPVKKKKALMIDL